MKHKLLGLTLAVFMTACSSTTTGKFPDLTRMIPSLSEEPPVVSKVVAPEWTALKSGVYHESSGKAVFYGLGKASKEDNSPDRKTLSEDRARNELAEVLTSYMQRLAVEISKSNFGNSVTNINHDRLKDSMEEGTATIMMDAEITNHYLDSDNGKVYSMAKLDLSRLTEKLDGFKTISIEDRSFLKESIVQAHTDMTNGAVGQVALVEKSVDMQPKLDRQLSY